MGGEYQDEWSRLRRPRGGVMAARARRAAHRAGGVALSWAQGRARRPLSSSSVAIALGAVLGVALMAAPSLREMATGGYERLTQIATARPEFEIRRLSITGATQLEDPELIVALGLDKGPIPSLEFDAHSARARVEALGWVETATVRAAPPQLVEVTIVERKPAARWRRAGRLALIDASGAVIADSLDLAAGRYGGLARAQLLALPLIVGDGAAGHAREALALDDAAQMAGLQLIGWTRIGDRRWDLELQGGARIMLPEADPGAALALFVHWAEKTDLLEHRFTLYDFRDPAAPVAR